MISDALLVCHVQPMGDAPLHRRRPADVYRGRSAHNGARWRQAALAAYSAGAVTGARTVELLRGRYTGFHKDDLPTLDMETAEP